jgi:NitT/TauT family transport system permease protein
MRRLGAAAIEYAPPVLTLAAIVAVWHVVVASGRVPEYLVPAPGDVAGRIVSGWRLFVTHSVPTLTAITGGFFGAILIGLPLSVAMVYSKVFQRTVYPLLVGSQVVPKIALAPIFVVWFGFGMSSKMLMAFLIAFFPVVIAATAGLAATRPQSIMLIRSMGGGIWQEFWAVRWPMALPSIFAGLKVSVTLAVVGAIVGEFVGSDNGLGYLLVLARGAFDSVTIFAVIVWLSVLGLLYYSVVEIAERLLVPGPANRRRPGRDAAKEVTM